MAREIVGFCFKGERINVGGDIPHTVPRDIDDPPQVHGKPQVWFTTDKNKVPNVAPDKRRIYVHRLVLNDDKVIFDTHVSHWGVTLGPAIVRSVEEIINPHYGDY